MLTCIHLGGPGNWIQWLRNGTLLAQEAADAINIERLVVGEVFTCIVTNHAGEDRDDIILNVFSPTFSSQPSSIFINSSGLTISGQTITK